jgi:hypothetical protein
MAAQKNKSSQSLQSVTRIKKQNFVVTVTARRPSHAGFFKFLAVQVLIELQHTAPASSRPTGLYYIAFFYVFSLQL